MEDVDENLVNGIYSLIAVLMTSSICTAEQLQYYVTESKT